ncbi:MAG TPA: site-2 protease family protein [Acetobacteraceae bacterium]|nr:site-2 protease family protein [Acetobacteraceae bacterium]
MTDLIFQVAMAVIPAILAITLHEAAHGYMALALGDDTARLAGRLSLNPIRHVDRVGTILLPGFLLLFQLLTIHRVVFMFGWAKPVPVSAWKFRDPRRGMAVVAVAGPAMNFFLAWVAALLLPAPTGLADNGLDYLEVVIAQHPVVGLFLFYFMLTNLVLGLFNLLPIPPLDGGRIAVGLLPLELARSWAKLERVGIVLVIVLILVPHLIPGFDPLGAALNSVVPWAFDVLLRLAGHDVGGTDVRI